MLLASNLIALFRVDQPWTEKHLLPLFDWTTDLAEARAAWEGFLWSPRLYRPLLITLKTKLLDTVKHYDKLGQHAAQFAAFLTYAALNMGDIYTKREFQEAWAALPQGGLDESAQALVHALEGADEQREDYWANRIRPFWQHIWPKSLQFGSKSIAESLARLSIAARNAFPKALPAVYAWLLPIEHADIVVHLLHESKLADRFPEEALRLLDVIIKDQAWPPSELKECLTSISQKAPELSQDQRHRRLQEYLRQQGS